MNSHGHDEVSSAWVDALRDGGYTHEVGSCKKIKKMPRLWKKIFKNLNINSKKSFLEIGCGGGKHLVLLAANGHDCVGIDISSEVLDRASAYKSDIERQCGDKLNLEFMQANIFDDTDFVDRTFDVVFHVGVIEHFLEEADRLAFLKSMAKYTNEGGYVISVVPSGGHPHRQEQRSLGLGGYAIPEIDYTPEIMRREFEAVGLSDIEVYGHNMFDYLNFENSLGLVKIFKRICFLAAQTIPVEWFGKNTVSTHAGTLICVGKK